MKGAAKIQHFDWYVVIPTVFLLGIGLIIQSSVAYKQIGVPLEISILTQVSAAVLALIGGLVLRQFSMTQIRRRLPLVAAFVWLVLCAVLIVGEEIGGATRWLQIGSLQLQPTEIAKIALIFLLAHQFDTHRYRANTWRIIGSSLFITLLMAAAVALQPDLGSAIVFIAIWLSMLLVSRIKLSRFAFVVIGLLAFSVLLLPFMAEYQQERLVSYFNPNRDVSGAAYNVRQAGIAIGSGGITGQGLSGGSQSQLNFLPSQHTDFIFAVTAEKLGLIGAGLVIIAFLALIMRLLYCAWLSNKQFYRLIYAGTAGLIGFHVVVNIGMNMGLVPVTGLPLPFLSYGGTFLFSSLALIAYIAMLPLEQSEVNHLYRGDDI